MPGHWRSQPRSPRATAGLYRRRFERPAPARAAAGSRSTGSSTRPTSGSTAPTSVTPRATSSRTASTSPRSRAGRRTRAGGRGDVLARARHDRPAQHHRDLPALRGGRPDWNPGGLWRTVRIHDTGPVRIDRLRVLCRDADETRAHLRLHARSTRRRPHGARCARPPRRRCRRDRAPLAAGNNDIEWSLDIDPPRLWWPRALGGQALTDDRASMSSSTAR